MHVQQKSCFILHCLLINDSEAVVSMDLRASVSNPCTAMCLFTVSVAHYLQRAASLALSAAQAPSWVSMCLICRTPCLGHSEILCLILTFSKFGFSLI